MFQNAIDILVIIKARALKWLQNLAKIDNTRLPRKVLASWTPNSRKPGRPQLNICNTCIEALFTLSPKHELQWQP
jgi:hypothetical protein